MANQKHTKAQEEAYRRGYHQAVSEALRLLEAGIEQQVDPEQILTLFQGWERKIATWRGALDTGRLLDPPPSAGEPRLRLVEREAEEEDEQEDERVDPRIREIIARVRDVPRSQIHLSTTFAELRMTGVPNLMYLQDALLEVEKVFGVTFGPGELEEFSYGTVGALIGFLEGEE